MAGLEETNELFKLLGDPTRLRLLSVLHGRELTVAELTEITGAPQSRVSSHLGRLKDAELLSLRREGTTSFYTLDSNKLSGPCQKHLRVWLEDGADPLLTADREHARKLEAARTERRPWPDAVAGQMERHYSPGRTWEANARAVFGLLELGDVLDIASGDGVIAELIAHEARRVTCLDLSERVVKAGRERLGHVENVAFIRGDMHELPFASGRFDQVLFVNALAYSTKPRRAIEEACRVLAPGGCLVGAALAAHGHREAVAPYGHLNCGFEPETLESSLKRAGLVVELCKVTSRERRPPHFEVITLRAKKPRDQKGPR
ncbi:MAG: metalloregulator ArsR/SmtB family transcription factor [Deltaproteobacteria bacterium]|nr:metalloregulator ArsR/SmtB family transcription factor [Deltaproteobacteria bacterium]